MEVGHRGHSGQIVTRGVAEVSKRGVAYARTQLL
jgi:hypothetical protein